MTQIGAYTLQLCCDTCGKVLKIERERVREAAYRTAEDHYKWRVSRGGRGKDFCPTCAPPKKVRGQARELTTAEKEKRLLKKIERVYGPNEEYVAGWRDTSGEGVMERGLWRSEDAPLSNAAVLVGLTEERYDAALRDRYPLDFVDVYTFGEIVSQKLVDRYRAGQE